MDSAIRLREYQSECLEKVISEFKAGVTQQLVILPTGSGKTVVMASIAKEINKRTLILAHREELITQANEKFKLFWPDVSLGICMAERDEIDSQVVVGSIQSCSQPKRLERLKAQGFDVLMIDEAHHSTADTYRTVIEELGFNKGKLLIGVSATPERGDDQGLGNVYDKIVYSQSISTMIRAGYLSPIIGRRILTDIVLERIKTRNGDYAIDELSRAVNVPERNQFVVSKYIQHAGHRKGVAFCVDVQHCKDLSDAFNNAGIACKAVYGAMGKDERKKALDDLKKGKIQVATSCGVLTEGFDEPSLSVIAMCRPTRSKSLYIQCAGRGLRLFPGKENCLILDFTDSGHTLTSSLSLKTTIPEAYCIEDRQQEDSESDHENPYHRGIQSLSEKCDNEFDVLGTARFTWVPVENGEWSLIDDNKLEIVMKPEGSGFVADIYNPDGSCSQIVNTALPLEYCFGVCEDYARQHLAIAFADARKPWMKEEIEPTLKQREFLEKNHAFVEGMTKAEASIEIRRIIALKNQQRRKMGSEPLTEMQKYFLDARGFDTKNMSKIMAMQTIAKLKQSQKVV